MTRSVFNVPSIIQQDNLLKEKSMVSKRRLHPLYKLDSSKRHEGIRGVMTPRQSTGFPNLDDLRKTIPPGGLLNPGLRKNSGLGTK